MQLEHDEAAKIRDRAKVHDIVASEERLRERIHEIGSRLGQSERTCEALRRQVAALTEKLAQCGVTVAHEDRVVSD